MTDITELAQMKGQKVEGSYYLAECTDCGKMYPSNNLNGGEPLFSGDYGECYCPHCNADDAAIGDCGDAAAMAWNYQQDRIDALVEALEKAQQRIDELESRTVTFKLPFTPEPSAYSPWVAKAFYQFHRDTVKSCFAVFSDACAAAGIKVEDE
ncbi:TPA: hypothetical protein ACYF11_002410 [Klebsiella pneumoniae]|nr:hypothetical protein [uncultured Pantoea sp.]MCE0097308.1 hypothetical protein [Klebsiella pneumoniae]MDZ0955930.1 hypothetical protein [Klebsiella pneumoniae]HBS7136420.1 hypothetical protein [Klebsiella pneumoniae]HEB5180207.1 hypothetical protein [Klebsiella pneumoniae]